MSSITPNSGNGRHDGHVKLNDGRRKQQLASKDGQRFRWIRQNLYAAAVCDILDDLGFRSQAMHQRLRPLDSENCVVVGRARTFRWMETDYSVDDDPYGLEIEAMDSLKAGDVVTVAKQNGAVGGICDGLVRDCKRILKMEFPVFHAGIRPVDSKGRGRVMAYDVPIRCGEVLVRPGELIFGDFDGVVVIPMEVEDKVMELAAKKVGKENASRRELLKGRSLRDVFDEYGVL
jgi:regulator of RNase E activity RraA